MTSKSPHLRSGWEDFQVSSASMNTCCVTTKCPHLRRSWEDGGKEGGREGGKEGGKHHLLHDFCGSRNEQNLPLFCLCSNVLQWTLEWQHSQCSPVLPPKTNDFWSVAREHCTNRIWRGSTSSQSTILHVGGACSTLLEQNQSCNERWGGGSPSAHLSYLLKLMIFGLWPGVACLYVLRRFGFIPRLRSEHKKVCVNFAGRMRLSRLIQ